VPRWEIIHHRELRAAGPGDDAALRLARRYAEEHLSAHAPLTRGAIDAVIEPHETRERLADVLVPGRAEAGQRAAARLERRHRHPQGPCPMTIISIALLADRVAEGCSPPGQQRVAWFYPWS
jgi:hypothetical protein